MAKKAAPPDTSPARVRESLKLLERADRRNGGPAAAFEATVELAFCAVAKSCAGNPEKAEAYEARYMKEVGRWDKATVSEVFVPIFSYALMSPGIDFWGTMAGESNALSAHLGQFFTPFEVCRLMAEISMGDIAETLRKSPRPFLTVHEPASGSGAMILAAAATVEARGYDLGTTMWVDAMDLSPLAFKMCYLSLSAAGIAGVVRHGNSLSRDQFDACLTPAASRFLSVHGNPFDRPKSYGAPPPRLRTRGTK